MKIKQLKPNILDEINNDPTAGATNPPVEGLKNGRFVSDEDTIVLEDEVYTSKHKHNAYYTNTPVNSCTPLSSYISHFLSGIGVCFCMQVCAFLFVRVRE